MNPFKRLWHRFLRSEAGVATIEFTIAVPIVLSILFSSIDFGGVMLRQVSLDRGVDMAVREVMLGNVPTNGMSTLRTLICNQTLLIPNCESSLTIELRPINTTTWAGLNSPVRCINRSAAIQPTLTFNPSSGNQDLMLMRVCASADPFISMTGYILGLNRSTWGDYTVVSISAFTNEPI